MTDQDLAIIRSTWAKVLPIAEQAADLFYGRLFEIAPDVQPMFAETDMTAQKGKLLTALNLAVQNADNPGALVPVLEEMGRRHVSYGVKDEHYDAVGAALIWTLEQGLGADFTDQARAAWTAVYGLVSDTMRRAAAEVSVNAA